MFKLKGVQHFQCRHHNSAGKCIFIYEGILKIKKKIWRRSYRTKSKLVEMGYFSNMEFYEEPRNYRQSLLLGIDKNVVFNTLTKEIPDWWSTIDGTYDKVGDEFKVSFGAESYWRFKVTTLNQPNEVVWECIESHQNHNLKGIDEEWINSKIYWSISESERKTKIDFLHDGLLSTGVCYDVCSNGWDFYILDSLKNYLENGKGKPSEK